MKKYKVNNSYTVYVPDRDEVYGEASTYGIESKAKNRGWCIGSNVYHSYYGRGIIQCIDNQKVAVNFLSVYKKGKYRKKASVTVDFPISSKNKDLTLL